MKRERGIVTQLQTRVTEQFGKKICTATDCENLAHALKENLNEVVSSQTLRRFFGLIKTTSRTSIFTLDILSKFCGYKDYENFRLLCGSSELEIFFGSDEHSGKDFWQKSEHLCRQIADSPELLITTHYRMMPFPMVRKYFMENHPMRDMLGTVYSQYFLSYLKYNNSNEARIFAYGFLYKSAFLQENTELLQFLHQIVAATELTTEVHVIPAGLKYGIMLHYADFTGNESLFTQTFEEMMSIRKQYISASRASACSFEYSVLELLIFTDRTEEMLFLVDHNTFHRSSTDQSIIPGERKRTHDEVWKILCACANQKAGDRNRSLQYLRTVNLDNLGFGWEKYYSIIFYLVQLEFSEPKDRRKILIKLNHLVEETRFSFFEQQLTLHKDAVLSC